jgi:hypothetical protein
MRSIWIQQPASSPELPTIYAGFVDAGDKLVPDLVKWGKHRMLFVCKRHSATCNYDL